jgi:hypothetical protein
MEQLLNVVRRKYMVDQRVEGTLDDASYIIYYGTEDGWVDGRYDLVVDVVSFDREERFCILTQLRFRGNEAATEVKLRDRGIGSVRAYVLRACVRECSANPMRVQIRADHPARGKFFIESEDGDLRFEARVEVKMLGTHRGETVVFNFGALFSQICSASGISMDDK